MSENRKAKVEREVVRELPRDVPMPRYDFQKPLFSSLSQATGDQSRPNASAVETPASLRNVVLTL